MSESMRIVDTGPDAYLASLPDEHRDSLISVDRKIHSALSVKWPVWLSQTALQPLCGKPTQITLAGWSGWSGWSADADLV